MGTSPEFYTKGNSFCPKGSLHIKLWLVPLESYSAPAFELYIYSSPTDDSSVPVKSFRIVFYRSPDRFTYEVENNGETDIAGTFTTLKSGQGFDLRIDCGDNSFDIYLNNLKIHGISDIHADFKPFVTMIQTQQDLSMVYTVDFHWTFCEYKNNTAFTTFIPQKAVRLHSLKRDDIVAHGRFHIKSICYKITQKIWHLYKIFLDAVNLHIYSIQCLHNIKFY